MHLRVRSYRFDPCPYYMFFVYRTALTADMGAVGSHFY